MLAFIALSQNQLAYAAASSYTGHLADPQHGPIPFVSPTLERVFTVNLDEQRADVSGRVAPLTGKEYRMLELLALRKGSTITEEMFLSHLYGGMDEPEMKIIDVFICKLRKKPAKASQGKDYIETVWGRGYALHDGRLAANCASAS